MKKYIKVVLVLTSICAVAAVLLALVNSVTAPIISLHEEEAAMKALEEVSCGMEIGDRTDMTESETVNHYYKLHIAGGVTGGYILDLSGKGYGGALALVACYDPNGKLLAAKIVSENETPGVGKKATLSGYMDKFIGKGTQFPIPTAKRMLTDEEAIAVSGATMTFTGVSKALAAGSELVKSLGGK
ncbi:MAG: FMN-binding protein [Sphaerochaetaceae bacterium]|nr:FMN-binding protein [Sphaerochaetaceae bacterium]